ncbi:MAG: 2,3-bisphosphoglycerate-independent phosphoglycerate mutase [Helicobacter sp.]|nr:2,3-bisphosphoglycerate-independent phosphoglycerate mutase [Helicobacter sp.]
MQKTILIIADGIGHNDSDYYNAFAHAKKPAYDYLFANVPHALIHTYGEFVGLPDGQMGNSEVGHMSIGSGRVLYQYLVQIDRAIKDKSFELNKKLQDFLNRSKRVHIIGLISDGGVHSHINHFLEAAKVASKKNTEVFLHLITDGRDVSPESGVHFVEQVQDFIKEYKNIKIASLSGRFYAMDRDKRFERTKQAYDAIVKGSFASPKNPLDYVKSSYSEGIYDEFIKPASFGDFSGIKEDDGVFCINFRSDRMRQIVSSLASGFSEFEQKLILENEAILTATEYDESFSFPVLFPKSDIKNTLSQVIAEANLTQMHTAETEKYAHVTFFFNGGIEEPYPNESRVLIPSPKVKTYDLKPEMSAPEVGEAVLKAMNENKDFILVNFANGDMVGHTGVFEAGIKAVEAVDEQLLKIIELAKKLDYALIITADHGNCEKMRGENGEILTNHTVGDVWCFVLAHGVRSVKNGSLCNIAASVLKLLDLPKPPEMEEALF